jgi:hypothetical protein
MNDQTDQLDQADEGILTYTASDEALEAAGTGDRTRFVPTIGGCLPPTYPTHPPTPGCPAK